PAAGGRWYGLRTLQLQCHGRFTAPALEHYRRQPADGDDARRQRRLSQRHADQPGHVEFHADCPRHPPDAGAALATVLRHDPPAPVLAYSAAPTATVGAAYSPFQFTASGGLGQLAWSETPALTIGLTLSSAGVLSGTPNANAAGWYPIALNATDTLNQHAASVP